ncbi:hypothetical protein ACAX43_28665 [Paraburkholderia sp. IW21]|uniref:hypothetical protein n=1 Tax=Paraburkholderia sp. IW21 TaxID=3242488 RepID=UPI0035207A39
MSLLGLPFRRRHAQEPTPEQTRSIETQCSERIRTIGICVQFLRLMPDFMFDAGFRRLVPGATFFPRRSRTTPP